MEAPASSDSAVAVLRAIGRGGFAYAQTKELARAAGWNLVDDEWDLGYLRFDIPFAAGQDPPSSLVIEVQESGRPPRAVVTLFYFEDYKVDRGPFDEAFRGLAAQLVGVLGAPAQCGEYSYPHRAGWSYSYASWSLADVTFVLVQDELDIQFGMDVSLWVLPAGAAVNVPVSGA